MWREKKKRRILLLSETKEKKCFKNRNFLKSKKFKNIFVSRYVSTHRSFFESIWVDSSTLDSTIRFVRKFYTDIVIFRFLALFLTTSSDWILIFFCQKKSKLGISLGSGFNVPNFDWYHSFETKSSQVKRGHITKVFLVPRFSYR